MIQLRLRYKLKQLGVDFNVAEDTYSLWTEHFFSVCRASSFALLFFSFMNSVVTIIAVVIRQNRLRLKGKYHVVSGVRA